MHALKVKKLNFWQSIIGLIGKKNPEPVLINTRFGIHTFGLKFPIDVFVLQKIKRGYPCIAGVTPNENNNIYKIVKIKKSLLPNHLFFWNIKYNTIMEIKNNLLSDKGIKINEAIVICS